jgi:3-hydroxyacyl-[acyl-carrier-protein] dehydratase
VRFVFVDRILELEPRRAIRTVKNVAMSEDIFEFHFPGFPVMPGSFSLEAFEEASVLLLGAGANFAVVPTLTAFANVKYRRFVRPGSQIVVEARLAAPAMTRCRATVDGREVARADLEFELAACPPGSAYEERLRALHDLIVSFN